MTVKSAIQSILVQDALVKILVRSRDVVCGVVQAEIEGLQMHLGNFCGHYGEVFDPRVVGEPEGMPDDNVLILDNIAVLDPRLDASASERLVGVISCWEELSVLVLGDPDRVLGKF